MFEVWLNARWRRNNPRNLLESCGNHTTLKAGTRRSSNVRPVSYLSYWRVARGEYLGRLTLCGFSPARAGRLSSIKKAECRSRSKYGVVVSEEN
jgi:hypothetical protein